MSQSYIIFSVIIILLVVFLYISWIFVSNEIDRKKENKTKRRDFLYTASYAMGAVGLGSVIWPLVDQMNPDASVKALATTEVDISSVEPGKSITVLWRGKPIFIKRRTQEEIKEAENIKLEDLKDPQNDKDRVKKPEWLVMVGVCTHLGCVPLGDKGDYNGWFCPCHGSHYDTSGRIRKGPAPTNMEVPKYKFVNTNTIRIG
jgi:ubiquinol-cytochrome c reductase iron-sulfur subunit